MKPSKISHKTKQQIRLYILPHTDTQASIKFRVPVAAVRAIMKRGVFIKKPGYNPKYRYAEKEKTKTGL